MSWGEAFFLKKTIVGQKRFTTSSEKILALNNNIVEVRGSATSIIKFKPKISGVVRFSANYYTTMPFDSNFTIGIKTEPNGDWLQSRTLYGNNTGNTSGNITFDQNLDANSDYYLVCESNTLASTLQISNTKIYGDIIDAEWFEWNT